MATRRGGVRIPVGLDTDPAEREAAGLTQQLADSFVPLVDVVELAQIAFENLGRALQAVNAFVLESIELANEQERVELRVKNALQLRGDATNEAFHRLQDFNSSLQQQVGIGDEVLLQLQGTLSAMGVHTSQLETATKATIGLAEVTGGGLNEASKVAAKAIQGDTGALKEYAIIVNSTEAAERRLLNLFQLKVGQSNTLATATSVLSANYGDLQEEIGKTITDSEEVRQAVQDLAVGVRNIGVLVVEHRPAIVSFLDTMIDRIRQLGSLLETAAPTLAQIFGPVGQAIAVGAAGVAGVRLSSEAGGETKPIRPGGRELGSPDVPIRELDIASIEQDAKRREAEAEQRRQQAAKETERFLATAEARMDAAMERIRRKQEQLQQETITAQAEFDAAIASHRAESATLEVQIETDRVEAINEAKQIGFDTFRAHDERQLAQTQQFYSQLAVIGAAGIGNFTNTITQGLLSGQASVGDAMKGLLGTVLSGVGQAFIALGSAALVAATSSSAIPLLWPIFGGPIGVAGALGIISAGGILTGFGQGVATSARSTESAAASAANTGSFRAPDLPASSTFDRPFDSNAGQRPLQIINVNVDGSRGLVFGSEQGMARAIRDLLNENEAFSF